MSCRVVSCLYQISDIADSSDENSGSGKLLFELLGSGLEGNPSFLRAVWSSRDPDELAVACSDGTIFQMSVRTILSSGKTSFSEGDLLSLESVRKVVITDKVYLEAC
jgi:hypothetical protein